MSLRSAVEAADSLSRMRVITVEQAVLTTVVVVYSLDRAGLCHRVTAVLLIFC